MSPALAQALAVALGGALGALLRHAANLFFIRQGFGGLPASTLLVNVLGCLLAGFVLMWIDQRTDPVLWRALLVTGVLGALTTFSALGLELWQLLRADRWDLFALMLLAHVVLGVLAVAAGYAAGRGLFGASG
jgi:CrcB protein